MRRLPGLIVPAVLATLLCITGPARANTVTLDILTYNTYLRPFVPEGQDRRAPLMARELRGYDVLLLQEVFSDWHRKLLLDDLAADYPHRTRVVGRDRGFRQDGGIVILSKWPIERETQRGFGALCAASDCLADKGVLYARIRKQALTFHVFATHLQSGTDQSAMRSRQIAVVRDLIDELALPTDEPVLIGGDLNTDRFTDQRDGAFTAMTRVLNAVHPEPPPGGAHEPTLDPAHNRLVTQEAEYVDYLLYSAAHLRPRSASNEVFGLFAGDLPLSDHFAVRGRFRFDAARAAGRLEAAGTGREPGLP